MEHPNPSAAQRAVLGLALMAPAAASAVCDRLRDDQLDPPASHVLAGIRELLTEGTTPEPVTLTSWLAARGLLEQIGGHRAVDALTAEAASIGSIDHLCRELVEHATWRDRAEAAQSVVGAAAARDESAWAQAMEGAEADHGASGLETFTPEQWASEVFEHLDSGTGIPDDVIPTPWSELNHGLNGGLWPGEIALILGYRNHGKSVVASDIAHHAGASGFRTHMYLTEDHGIGRGGRVASRASGVPSWRIAQRRLGPGDHDRIVQGLARMPYGKTPCAGRTAQEVCAHIRRSKWDLAIVDHFHDLAYRDEADIRAMVSAFRQEANRGRTAIVLCVQPNMSAATAGVTPRVRNPPVAHNVKGGGALADAANTLLTIHQEQEDDGTPTGEGKLRAAKTRTSHYPTVEVLLNGRYTSFAPNLDLEAAA